MESPLSPTAVDDALRVLLDQDQTIDVDRVQTLLTAEEPLPQVTDVQVSDPDLSSFDGLLTDMEVYDDASGDRRTASECLVLLNVVDAGGQRDFAYGQAALA